MYIPLHSTLLVNNNMLDNRFLGWMHVEQEIYQCTCTWRHTQISQMGVIFGMHVDQEPYQCTCTWRHTPNA